MDVKAIKSKSLFRLEYSVSLTINAKPDNIWFVLTDAENYPVWNSTVISMEGQIQPYQEIRLRVRIDPGRTFKLKVTSFKPPVELVWEDGIAPLFKGTRTFTIQPESFGVSVFTMREVFNGIMLPLIAGSLPDFRSAFEQFAVDLKNQVEGNA